MKKIVVNLECVTNMHVGNGDVNFNIIDNEVERDVVTGYPTINASGVKGALREYFKKNVAEDKVKKIFGDIESGKLKFLCANMLAIPMRASEGNEAYYLVSTKEALDEYEKICTMFDIKETKMSTQSVTESISVEGVKLSEKVMMGEKTIYLMNNDIFRKMALPVVARNCLENGKSVNLWYEEIVPHKSLFYFVVMAEDADKEFFDLFKETVENQIIQFGGNATIGYGLCKVSVTEGK